MADPSMQTTSGANAKRSSARSTVARLGFGLGLLFAVLAPSTSPAQPTVDSDTRMRIIQLLQLGRSHAPNARAELERGLSDPAESVRIAAASGLVALGDTSAIPALERRATSETAPTVKTRLEAAIVQLRKATLDSAKFVVQLGNMTNNTTVQNARLPDVMRTAAKAHASHLKGALVVDGPGDALYQKAAERHLPVLMLDGQLARFSRAEASGNVTFAAQVEFVVRKVPSQVLKGTFHGGAAGSDSPKALESTRRLAELQGEVVSGAVESALRGAERSLVEASR
jgi:hypothetical protein